MTYQEHEAIFSKEALSIADVQKLMDCSKSKAAELIRTWKRKLMFECKKPRIDFDGKIHVLDYLWLMGLDPAAPGERYFKNMEEKENGKPSASRSVCL